MGLEEEALGKGWKREGLSHERKINIFQTAGCGLEVCCKIGLVVQVFLTWSPWTWLSLPPRGSRMGLYCKIIDFLCNPMGFVLCI